MSQSELMTWMAGAYLLGCALALILSLRDHDNALQVVVYAGTLLGFYAFFGGQAHNLRWAWYLLNAGTDFFIITCAVLIRARSSVLVAGFGAVALVVDLAYFCGSYSGHKLPGIGYFYASNIVLALQVASMIVLSGGCISCCRGLGAGLCISSNGKRKSRGTSTDTAIPNHRPVAADPALRPRRRGRLARPRLPQHHGQIPEGRYPFRYHRHDHEHAGSQHRQDLH